MNKAPGVQSVGTRLLLELVDKISEFVADLYCPTTLHFCL